MIELTQLSIPLGLLGLLSALAVYFYVVKQPDGNDAMREIARRIQDGAMAFLRREYTTLLIFIVAIAALLWYTTSRETALAYVTGAFSSMLAGLFGMIAATRANVRTAAAAQ